MLEKFLDGLWRPGGAFFQIDLGSVMSHHHIEGLCTFLFKFWRENLKWSSCQQLVFKNQNWQMYFPKNWIVAYYFFPFLALSRRGRSEECRSWIAVHLQDPRPGSSQVLVRWNRGMQKKCQDMPMGARPTRNQSVRCGHYHNAR